MLIVYSLFVTVLTVVSVAIVFCSWLDGELSSNDSGGWFIFYALLALVWYWVIKHLPSIMGL